MKFDRLFVLHLGADANVMREASDYIGYAGPTATVIGYSEKTFFTFKRFFILLADGVLTDRLTLRDKVMIFAHGDPAFVQGASNYTPVDLAKKLKQWGIERAGLITLKCCNVGTGNYLEQFKEALASEGVEVGWLKAYKGFATQQSTLKGHPSQKISITEKPQDDNEILQGDARYKVVPGTISISVDGSARYTAAGGGAS